VYISTLFNFNRVLTDTIVYCSPLRFANDRNKRKSSTWNTTNSFTFELVLPFPERFKHVIEKFLYIYSEEHVDDERGEWMNESAMI